MSRTGESSCCRRRSPTDGPGVSRETPPVMFHVKHPVLGA
jgi:hypothetical protein